jgi:hypothetical protein
MCADDTRLAFSATSVFTGFRAWLANRVKRSRPINMPLPLDESARLQALYFNMTDGELQEIAADPGSLTDLARAALAKEFERRNLTAPDSDKHTNFVEPEIEFQDLVTIRRFRNLHEALLAKGSLDSAAIESHLADDNMVRIFVSTFVDGVRLLVRRADAEAAQQILDEPPVGDAGDDENISDF